MNFMKLVQSIEAGLFELSLWLLMWPKTLWQTARRPSWVHDYVDQEAAKKFDDQYDGYMSPALFLAISVLGWLVSLELIDQSILSALAKAFGATEPSFDHKFLVLVGAAMLLPMVFALVSTRAEKLELTRRTIRLSFNKHAYTTAAFWGLLLVAGVVLVILALLLPEELLGVLMLIMPLLCMVWFCYAQSRIFADELKVGRFKGLRLAFGAGIIWLFIVSMVIIVVFGDSLEDASAADAAQIEQQPPSP